MEEDEYGTAYKEVNCRKSFGGTSWGPEKFRKDNHPLAIMVIYYVYRNFISHLDQHHYHRLKVDG